MIDNAGWQVLIINRRILWGKLLVCQSPDKTPDGPKYEQTTTRIIKEYVYMGNQVKRIVRSDHRTNAMFHANFPCCGNFHKSVRLRGSHDRLPVQRISKLVCHWQHRGARIKTQAGLPRAPTSIELLRVPKSGGKPPHSKDTRRDATLLPFPMEHAFRRLNGGAKLLDFGQRVVEIEAGPGGRPHVIRLCSGMAQ